MPVAALEIGAHIFFLTLKDLLCIMFEVLPKIYIETIKKHTDSPIAKIQ